MDTVGKDRQSNPYSLIAWAKLSLCQLGMGGQSIVGNLSQDYSITWYSEIYISTATGQTQNPGLSHMLGTTGQRSTQMDETPTEWKENTL